MDKKESEEVAKLFADFVEEKFNEFLQKEAAQQFEIIRDNLPYNSPLKAFIVDVINNWEELKKDEFLKNRWMISENHQWQRMRFTFARLFPKFLYLSVLESLISSNSKLLPTKFKEETRDKHGLTAKIFQEETSKILNTFSLEKVKHGGSKKKLDHQEELIFLATYNRYLIVIKNARNEKRLLKKLKGAEVAEREAITKYDIPVRLINSTFSDDRASDVALDWSKDFIQTDMDEEYLKKLLIQIRKKQKIQKIFTIIDVDFTHGTRIYAVRVNDKQRIEKLRFTPLEKPFHQKSWGSDPDSFLVSVDIYR